LGGAIFNNQGATLTIANSTLTDNTAQGGAGGTGVNNGSAGKGLGGAIFNRHGTVTIHNSTLAGNEVAGPASDNTGGALFNLATAAGQTATVNFLNSIFADTTGGSDIANQQDAGTATIHADAPRVNIVESGINVISGTVNQSGVLSGPANEPQLAGLAPNGGPTQTLAITADSPAHQAGNLADAAGLAFDQRGPAFQRSLMDADLGAFALNVVPPKVTAINAVKHDIEKRLIIYQVTFSEAVTGVAPADFRVASTGKVNGIVGSVAGGDTTWFVTVNYKKAKGMIQLQLQDRNTIRSLAGALLGGMAERDGDFASTLMQVGMIR
jgi:hypothetical protein